MSLKNQTRRSGWYYWTIWDRQINSAPRYGWLTLPDSGDVIIRGKKREGLASDEKNPSLKVGMVFQSARLFDSLTFGKTLVFVYTNTLLCRNQRLGKLSMSL